ncbi:hypothetical protein F5Y10DRAFT_74939 [Nemania abortiva]|nr:hypothetical protein F5Y10DRAFT_74939 [Nemania abortiva]
MQSQTPQDQESPPQGKRSTSFGKFLKKARMLGKKEKPSASASATPVPATPIPPTPEPEVAMSLGIPLGPLGQPLPRHPRPQRHHNPTENDLHDNIIALQTALNDNWPRRHHSRYRHARALLVCWADNTRMDAPMPPVSPTSIRSPSLSLFPTTTTNRSSAASNGTSMSRMASGDSRINSSTSFGQDANVGPFIPSAHGLADVFERRYGIQSQVWMIPSLENPQDMLIGKVKQFVEDYGGSDSLLIFWYGGHAEFVVTPSSGNTLGRDKDAGEIIWYGLRDQRGVPARAVCKALGTARGDVLLLNDSPFSQHAYMSHISGPGTFELLGSGSMSPSHVEPNPSREGSFTRTLTLMLDSPFLAGHGVSILELHRKLLDVMTPKSSVLDTVNQRTTSPDVFPADTFPASTSPTDTSSKYSTAESSRPQRRLRHSKSSLVVAEAAKPPSIPPYPVYCQVAQTTQLERDARRSIVLSRLDRSLALETHYPRNIGEPRVRLDIRLKRPFLDVRRWREWILRAPEEAQEVSVTPGSQPAPQTD